MANKRGITLNSGSVSSTLSRFKNDGIAVLEGNRYILKEYADKRAAENVHEIWGAPRRAVNLDL